MCLSDASNLHAKRYCKIVCGLIQKTNNKPQYGGEKYLNWEGLVDQNTSGSYFFLTFLSMWVYRQTISNQCWSVYGSSLHNSEYCFDCRTQGGVHFGRPFKSNRINRIINSQFQTLPFFLLIIFFYFKRNNESIFYIDIFQDLAIHSLHPNQKKVFLECEKYCVNSYIRRTVREEVRPLASKYIE